MKACWCKDVSEFEGCEEKKVYSPKTAAARVSGSSDSFARSVKGISP